jgi:predicted DNA-binding protein
MEKGKRKIYNTTLNTELTRRIKILAAQMGKRQNDLLEEAIWDLLNKYRRDKETYGLSPSKG